MFMYSTIQSKYAIKSYNPTPYSTTKVKACQVFCELAHLVCIPWLVTSTDGPRTYTSYSFLMAIVTLLMS